MRKRPGWLTAVCIIAIVLGSLGIMSAMGSAVAMFVGADRMQNFFGQAGPDPRMADVQARMNEELVALSKRWQSFNAVMLAMHFLVAPALVAAAIMVLNFSPAGRRFLVGVFIAAVLFELVRVVPQMMMTVESGQITSRHMGEIMKGATPPNQPMPPFMANFMSSFTAIWTWVVAGWMALLTILKVTFYVLGARYLGRPTIRGLFEPPAAMPLATQSATLADQGGQPSGPMAN